MAAVVPNEVVIRSEEDAWGALERAVRGEGFPGDVQLRFEGWPIFELDVKGRDWDSSVPTRIMPSLLDVQKDINRAYASIRYDEFNLRRLKEDERDDLEVVIKVEKGSSIFSAELWQQLSRMAEAAVGRMDGNQIVITVLGVALGITSAVMFKAWLASRQKEKELDNQVELSKQEVARLKVFADAMQQRPQLQEVRADAEATNSRLLKATKPGDTMNIGGETIPAEQAEVLVQAERERAQEVAVSGVFFILGNRTDKGDGFRITVQRQSDRLTLNADVPLTLATDQHELIQQAEWSKGLVRLQIEASMLRESITQAVVTKAEAIS